MNLRYKRTTVHNETIGNFDKEISFLDSLQNNSYNSDADFTISDSVKVICWGK